MGTLATTYHCSIAKAMPINAATGMSASTAAVPRTAMAAHALKLTKAFLLFELRCRECSWDDVVKSGDDRTGGLKRRETAV
jgi:hypothetical protein